jgi:hypothetical protein
MGTRTIVCAAVVLIAATGCGQATSQPASSHAPPASSHAPPASSHAPPASSQASHLITDRLAAAAGATRSTGSARISLHMTMGLPQGSISMVGAGAFTFGRPASGSMHLSMHSPSMQTAITMDEVVIGTTVYMRGPVFAAHLPASKPWLKMDLQKVRSGDGSTRSKSPSPLRCTC